MATRISDNIRLGTFVLGGLFVLVLLLYMIGRNEHLFGTTYVLKARFHNAQGLVKGNNVRFSGIQVGTVRKITIEESTQIEVTMSIDKKMRRVIRKDAVVSIGTDGLVGDKVVDITPVSLICSLARDGDTLTTKPVVSLAALLDTLDHSGRDISVIASELKMTVQRVNRSAIWSLLDDSTVPADIKVTLSNIRQASGRASVMAGGLDRLVQDMRAGRGAAGILLADTVLAGDIRQAGKRIRLAGETADSLIGTLKNVAGDVQAGVAKNNGVVHALLYDTAIIEKLNTSLDHIQKGTEGFSQSMEALKHSFLLRGYFRKQEKQKKKNK
ncbi:MlaD family protein [Niabella drilacis]|uniref:Phospholipid/cholesterol/gamma-HCH transport system substrate-binding protein n=1 Tax=Niabella drilacis (strain DSM 25811 / CCM 8410 / CCUG 62505 / LMG 26954 / E90) TaxID=1285928 RepID=A0A1G6REP0_NIADE|nr:MCE family protein [Niabella drilacis]SDD03109.1 phospholipid/cholesterol/gamma-HCH transport system substrate-binding protein [Niabella drilacis]